MASTRIDWTREQLITVLALYCQLPFGKMSKDNPIVKAVAVRIGRTPSAVAIRLVNFASLDPFHKARGIKGMGNTSANVRQIWNDYYGHWEQLAEFSTLPAIGITPEPAPETLLEIPTGPTEIVRQQKTRLGQQFFRNAVLAAYQNKCCITGIKAVELLRASHIVPWSESPADRLNPRNGLCLNALHDSAFDRGLITLDPDHKLIISKRIQSVMPSEIYAAMFARYEGRPIAAAEKFPPLENCLVHHRKSIFIA